MNACSVTWRYMLACCTAFWLLRPLLGCDFSHRGLRFLIRGHPGCHTTVARFFSGACHSGLCASGWARQRAGAHGRKGTLPRPRALSSRQRPSADCGLETLRLLVFMGMHYICHGNECRCEALHPGTSRCRRQRTLPRTPSCMRSLHAMPWGSFHFFI